MTFVCYNTIKSNWVINILKLYNFLQRKKLLFNKIMLTIMAFMLLIIDIHEYE